MKVMVRVRVGVGWGDWVPPPLLLVQVGLIWVGEGVGEARPLALARAVSLAGEDRVGWEDRVVEGVGVAPLEAASTTTTVSTTVVTGSRVVVVSVVEVFLTVTSPERMVERL